MCPEYQYYQKTKHHGTMMPEMHSCKVNGMVIDPSNLYICEKQCTTCYLYRQRHGTRPPAQVSQNNNARSSSSGGGIGTIIVLGIIVVVVLKVLGIL